MSKSRRRRSLVWAPAALAMASLLSAVPLHAQTTPSPAPTLAPLPTPKATQKPLHEIGHVKAHTAYCTAFEQYFNASTQPILAGDSTLGVVRLSLDDLNKSFHDVDGTSERYNLRLRLIHDVDELRATLGPAQDAVNQLRITANLTTDPARAKQTRDLAKYLQKALDRHKAMANDLLGMEQALTDYEQEHPASQPQPLAGGYDPDYQKLPEVARDVKEYLHFDEYVDRTKDAEASAADLADTIVQSC